MMTPEDKQGHSVKRITLPSGRSIEVVRPAETTPRPLHVCPSCDSELVQPISWREGDETCWELMLECPNCFWSERGVYSREQVDDLEDRLDDGLCDLISDLHRLAQANMAGDIERFTAALRADRILPEDF
jgi:hypothetical protein